MSNSTRWRKLIDIVADSGVNLIDTATSIPAAIQRPLIGEAMPKRKPGMLIASRALPDGEGPTIGDFALASHPRSEASLKRLRTDVIDLYQVHQWDGLTPLEETMEALDSLVRSGRCATSACSNWSGWHMMKGMEVARRTAASLRIGADSLTLQARRSRYNSFPLRSIRNSPSCVEPACGGLLSGKHRRDKTVEGSRVVAGWASRQSAMRTRCGTLSTNCEDRRSPSRLGGADRAGGLLAGRRSPR